MDSTPEVSTVFASITHGRYGKNPSNQNSCNKDNTNSNKGRDKWYENKLRDIDRETKRNLGLKIDSSGNDDDNDNEVRERDFALKFDFSKQCPSRVFKKSECRIR
ncbi:E3 ubiquitin-protein ligase UPL3 [Abeliophyllum distichum]|uniref:E3 ubiquitin-protein ligase UPL3 n=1 Tax=Abeliophyllum distichum TaxID=126358 RepID=A0ABD1RQL9_9LAMI